MAVPLLDFGIAPPPIVLSALPILVGFVGATLFTLLAPVESMLLVQFAPVETVGL